MKLNGSSLNNTWTKEIWHCVFLQASGPSPKSKKPPAKPVASSGGGSKKGGETKKNGKQAGNGEVSEDDSASASSTPKKGAKDTSRKRKTEESSPALMASNQESPACVKRAKTARDNNRDLGLCRYVSLACLCLSLCIIMEAAETNYKQKATNTIFIKIHLKWVLQTS